MSIWICPRCLRDDDRQSHHLYGQTVCKRCDYKKGSIRKYEKITEAAEKRVNEMRKSLGSLF
ncbi:hypothetical protein LCGC14_0561000 [marine sediment metagenome]|uniref:Uncharacterized protein n=1 Tax=marine sediment metagenome TaxID=412755 RepID=A0A0F9RS52_9ZZZZ